LRVGLNLVFLVPGETGGMEIYARELIPALIEAAPRVQFTAFINREAAAVGGPWSELMTAVTVPVRGANRTQWVLGEQTFLPALAMRARVDVLHSLGSTAPGWGRYRRLVTVHDLIYARYPEAHAGVRDLGMRVLVPLAVQRSHGVIADSRSTRDDLVELVGTPREKIAVVHLGLGSVRRSVAADTDDLCARLGLGGRMLLLSLSAKRPHKNLLALIDALALLAKDQRPVLVLAGYATDHERSLRERAHDLGLGDDVRFLGWLTVEDVEGLWAMARAFVFPSLYEGFGMPVLEAMARGVPVACADASSLPEVAGDAALLFDPSDRSAIANALRRVLSDEPLREQLRARGLTRAAQFTWRATAEKTLAAYEALLAGRPVGR
jgi:glycosyltransferase involved in cell wall biosynthesis